MGSGISSRPKPPVVANSVSVVEEQINTKNTVESRAKDIRDIESSGKFKIHEDIEDEEKVRDGPRAHDEDEEGEDKAEIIDPEDEAMYNEAGEFFAHTALALGMDNQELLFNLMYFDDGHSTTFGTMMNSVQQETLALHSSNNTPYKLKPASESAIAGLSSEVFVPVEGADRECSVCKDEMEKGCQIVRIPACSHFFHEECLIRWIKLVSVFCCLSFLLLTIITARVVSCVSS